MTRTELKDLKPGDALKLIMPNSRPYPAMEIPSSAYNTWSVLSQGVDEVELGRPFLINDNRKPGLEVITVLHDSGMVADVLQQGWRVFESRLGA